MTMTTTMARAGESILVGLLGAVATSFTLQNETLAVLAGVALLLLHLYWANRRREKDDALEHELARLRSENGTLAENQQLMLWFISEVIGDLSPHLAERGRRVAAQAKENFERAGIVMNIGRDATVGGDLTGRDRAGG